MKISFELSPRDIKYFRERLKVIRTSRDPDDEEAVLTAADEMLEEAYAAEAPEFVTIRLKQLEQLLEMLRDDEWRVEGRDRTRILDGIAYFADPDDMIPDRLPGIGYLDDAIMIELIARELTHEIAAYVDFCEFRQRGPTAKNDAKLEARRKALQTRMHRRQRRELDKLRSRAGSSTRRMNLRLW